MKLKLTERLLRMMNKADRKKLGLRTQDEIAAQGEVKTERELHRMVALESFLIASR